MKLLSVFILLICCSAAVQAEVKLIIEFDGQQHKIVRADKFETSKFMPQINPLAGTTSPHKALLSYKAKDKWAKIELTDPRLISAPLAQDGSGHKQAMLEKGVYTVTLPGDDIDLKSLTLALPRQNSTTKVEYAIVQ